MTKLLALCDEVLRLDARCEHFKSKMMTDVESTYAMAASTAKLARAVKLMVKALQSISEPECLVNVTYDDLMNRACDALQEAERELG